MADNRKYYYLKLKEDFFDTDEMKILESMKDGYLYSNILLKLYLKSLSNSGRLMYRNVSVHAGNPGNFDRAPGRHRRESIGCIQEAGFNRDAR